ncbi:helix-turn-helix domain-containing protein [Hoylesella enoeca]|uniref:Transcriptional regulator n=1 Tax=Hoylesella enoeca TaxID=76123 RepID=A0A0S2KKZ8_9BACT|nr:helix-turn-helix transcriptional regulator [Hoylesella enoeca]ALO48966.1 transcriptional regulator [Hoylesella enoeca]
MKDRIRQIMESQHMTQQTFAQFIGMSPASLSSIFNGRTRPTINIVEAIKNKIPGISTDWLLFGTGTMYKNSQRDSTQLPTSIDPTDSSQMLIFEDDSPTPLPSNLDTNKAQEGAHSILDRSRINMKYIDKQQRKITEIRVFYDDQTWETFSPDK